MAKSKSSTKETVVAAKAGSSSLSVVQQLVAFGDAISSLYGAYVKETPSKLKLVDAYLFYILITGVIQFVYRCVIIVVFVKTLFFKKSANNSCFIKKMTFSKKFKISFHLFSLLPGRNLPIQCISIRLHKLRRQFHLRSQPQNASQPCKRVKF